MTTVAHTMYRDGKAFTLHFTDIFFKVADGSYIDTSDESETSDDCDSINNSPSSYSSQSRSSSVVSSTDVTKNNNNTMIGNKKRKNSDESSETASTCSSGGVTPIKNTGIKKRIKNAVGDRFENSTSNNANAPSRTESNPSIIKKLFKVTAFFAHLLFRYMTTWTLILLFTSSMFEFYYLRIFGKALRNTAVHTSVVSFYFCWVMPASITVENFSLTGPLLRIFDILAHHLPMLYFLRFYYSGDIAIENTNNGENDGDTNNSSSLSLVQIQSLSSWVNIFYYIAYRLTLTKIMKVSVYKLYLVNLNWLYVSYFIVMSGMDLIVDPIMFAGNAEIEKTLNSELMVFDYFNGSGGQSNSGGHSNPWHLKLLFIALSGSTLFVVSKVWDTVIGRSYEEGKKTE